jgi:glycosyltransferase involved in cell wall biosynthesis
MLIGTSKMESLGFNTYIRKIMGKTVSYSIEKTLLKLSDSVITVSEGVAHELKTYYGCSGDRLYPIINVIDTAFYRPSMNFSSATNIKKTLLYVGRLSYGKGLIKLVESAAYVIKKYRDVEYILVGSGQIEDMLKEKVKRLGLENYFLFAGEIIDSLKILHYYQNANLFIFPPNYEGCPMAILEALSCGLPIITSDISFSMGLLRNNENALLINPTSVEELTEATLRLLNSPELCIKLGEAARKTAVERLDEEKNSIDIERVYQKSVTSFKSKEI